MIRVVINFVVPQIGLKNSLINGNGVTMKQHVINPWKQEVLYNSKCDSFSKRDEWAKTLERIIANVAEEGMRGGGKGCTNFSLFSFHVA